MLNPSSTGTLAQDTSTETVSTSIETVETESSVSETDQAESSLARDSEYSHQLDAEENSKQNQSDSIPESGLAYFYCIRCSIPRGIGLSHDGICVYCLEHEQQYCMAGGHETDRPLFVDAEGVEHSSCRECRERESTDEEVLLGQESDGE